MTWRYESSKCGHCGGALSNGRWGRKWCSSACKQAAYRERNPRPKAKRCECGSCQHARRVHKPVPHLAGTLVTNDRS